MRLRILQSCDQSWDAMTRRDGGRHCAQCDHLVLDLTRLTERQARLRRRAAGPGPACVRAVMVDGVARFRTQPARAPRWAKGLVALTLASACGGAEPALEGTTSLAPVESGEVGKPMLPGISIPAEPTLLTRAVPARELVMASSLAPTPAQRAQTLSKLALQHPAPSPSHPPMGQYIDMGMEIPWD